MTQPRGARLPVSTAVAPARRNRIVERANDLGLVDLRARDVLSKRLAGDGHAGQVQHVLHLVHQPAQAAGIEEILHEEFAGGTHIGEHRHLAREVVETLHVHRQAGTARHRHHVDDGVGRAAHGHVHADGVVEGGRREDLFRRQVLPHHVDDAAAGIRAHARVRGIGRHDRRRARQREAERFGNRHHGRRRAHHHAGAEGTRDAAFEFGPIVFADAAGALLVPVFPGVGPGPQFHAAPVPVELRAGRRIDERHAHADGAHDQAGRGLVAAAEQHGAVDRMAAQQLLGLHRQQVAVEHGRRLDERFRQRHRRQLDREAAGLQHAALHVLGARPQMLMAETEVAPGIDDADHRLALPVGGVVAALARARAVAEGAQIVDPEPAVAAEVFRTFTVGHSYRSNWLSRRSAGPASPKISSVSSGKISSRVIRSPGLVPQRTMSTHNALTASRATMKASK